jgi:two-component system, OmpR family, KDP operon response regulator KdpE
MKQALKILAVDEDSKSRTLLKRGLESYGYQVMTTDNGQEALMLAAQRTPHVILLELNLDAALSGLDVCRHLREWTTVPIIVVSMHHEKHTKIAALDAGADDYLTKPFDIDELEARIRAVLRRNTIEETRLPNTEVHVHDLTINLVKRRVTLKGQDIHLTPKEYDLLRLLVANAGKVMTYNILLQAVWGSKQVNADHYIRVYINTIRTKLSDSLTNGVRYIITEPGIGYRFVDI